MCWLALPWFYDSPWLFADNLSDQFMYKMKLVKAQLGEKEAQLGEKEAQLGEKEAQLALAKKMSAEKDIELQAAGKRSSMHVVSHWSFLPSPVT
jgi:hypothetical protein